MHESGETITIAELMSLSGVKFGTSGARGLVEAMTDRVCHAYTLGFLQHLRATGQMIRETRVAIAGDLRSSTPRIMAAAARAVRDAGCEPVNCGFLPTPALALFGIRHAIPSLMVTGSHIPDDRNGIKFYRADGEILKDDEAGIREQTISLEAGTFDGRGMQAVPFTLPRPDRSAYLQYRDRYLDRLPRGCLAGMRIGLYEHSSVAAELLAELLDALGAQVIRLGPSDSFVPVDTEAVREEDRLLGRAWAAEHRLDALVSTDGDGDRPLVGDERGEWLRGDVAGVLCARYLGVRDLVTPVSSNSVVEKCGWFDHVERTRIGSPYVIDAMSRRLQAGASAVAGYEANGGFLIGSDLTLEGGAISPLPTRDAVIVLLALLRLSKDHIQPLSGLLQMLPRRFTCSGRLQSFPSDIARQRIDALDSGDAEQDLEGIAALFGGRFGSARALDRTDGLRIIFDSEEIVHLRPSGNAPELRCYNEADSAERAAEMNRICLGILEGWR